MAVLGAPDIDLYDLTEDRGDEEGALVDAARTRYQKVVGDLREQILAGIPAPGETLPGQSKLAEDAGTDSAVINRALAVLAAEGLIRVEHGKKTVVLPRSRWRVEFEVRLPLDEHVRDKALREIRGALRRAADPHPAVSSPAADRSAYGVVVEMTVESADLAGAATVALGIGRQSAGTFPIAVMSAQEARPE